MVVLFSIRNNNDENWIVGRSRKITAASACGDRRGCRGDRMKMRAKEVVRDRGALDVTKDGAQNCTAHPTNKPIIY